jgi:hypothetical protein
MGLYENGAAGTSGRLSIKSSGGSGTRGIFWDGETLTIKGQITQTSEGGNVGRNMGAWAAGVQYYNLDAVTYGGYSWSSNSSHVSTNNTNAGTGYPGSGPWSLSPYAAKTIRQSASAQVFTELKNGTLTPNYIQFSAAKENITAGTTWATSPSVTLVNAATGGTTTTSGDTVYLTTASFAANQLVEVTSTSDGKTDKISIVRVKEGSDALTVILTNEAHTVAAANDGTVSSYVGSGTDIYVYEGATQLDYDGVGTAAGKWTVTAVGSSVTPGALSDGGNYATMAVVSGMSANQALVTFTISGKKLNGTTFSGIIKIQSLTKSIKGADGVSGAATVGAGIVFRGKWRRYEVGTTPRQYFGNSKRRDVVETNAVPPNTSMKYWLCKIDYTTSTAADGPPATGATENTYWEPFGATFDSVATDILFAQDVYADKTVNIGSNGSATIIALNADAANSNANPYISIGQGVSPGFGSAGIFLGYDGGVGKLSVTNGLIGGWSIGSTFISASRTLLKNDGVIELRNSEQSVKVTIDGGTTLPDPTAGSSNVSVTLPIQGPGTAYITTDTQYVTTSNTITISKTGSYRFRASIASSPLNSRPAAISQLMVARLYVNGVDQVAYTIVGPVENGAGDYPAFGLNFKDLTLNSGDTVYITLTNTFAVFTAGTISYYVPATTITGISNVPKVGINQEGFQIIQDSARYFTIKPSTLDFYNSSSGSQDRTIIGTQSGPLLLNNSFMNEWQNAYQNIYHRESLTPLVHEAAGGHDITSYFFGGYNRAFQLIRAYGIVGTGASTNWYGTPGFSYYNPAYFWYNVDTVTRNGSFEYTVTFVEPIYSYDTYREGTEYYSVFVGGRGTTPGFGLPQVTNISKTGFTVSFSQLSDLEDAQFSFIVVK